MPKQITTQEKQQKTRMMFVLSVKGMTHHFLKMAKKMKTILSLGYTCVGIPPNEAPSQWMCLNCKENW